MRSLLYAYSVPPSLCWVGGITQGVTLTTQYWVAGALFGGALVLLGYALQLITIDTDHI